MAYCFCRPTIYNPPAKPCDGCLQAHTIVVGCGQGLMPCGDNTSIELDVLNKNGAEAVYSLKSGGYNNTEFESVTISASGLLEVVTACIWEAHKVYDIWYTVTKGNLKNYGKVSFCMDNPCDEGCTNCNWDTGNCYGEGRRITFLKPCGALNQIYNATMGLSLYACDGTTSWTVQADTGVNATIAGGFITYSINNDVVIGKKYRVSWTASCSKYNMTTSGYFDLEIEDLCTGVTCSNGQHCEPCTGNCEENTSDLRIETTFGSTKGSTSIQGGGLKIN